MAASDESVDSAKKAFWKAELEAWGTKTTFGVLAGMLYGGCKEAMGFSELEETLLAKQSGTVDARQRRNLLREIMEQKVLRVARGTASGGAKLGLFAAVFCAVEQYLAIERNTHDTLNVVAAGSATAATVGLLLPGSLLWRIRTALVGSVVGATLGVPLGFVQSTLNEQVEKDNTASMPSSARQSEENKAPKYDAVGDAIRRLEERLSQK